MRKTNRQMRRKNKTQRGGYQDRSSVFQTVNEDQCSLVQDLNKKKDCLVERTFITDEEKEKFKKLGTKEDPTGLNELKKIIKSEVDEKWARMTDYDNVYGNRGNTFRQLFINHLSNLTKQLSPVEKAKVVNDFTDDVEDKLEDYKTMQREESKKNVLLYKAGLNPSTGNPISPTGGMNKKTKRYRRRKASRRRKTNKRRY
jgi:hypothetical protein